MKSYTFLSFYDVSFVVPCFFFFFCAHFSLLFFCFLIISFCFCFCFLRKKFWVPKVSIHTQFFK